MTPEPQQKWDAMVKINLGCGEKPLPGFLNVDSRDIPGIEYPNTSFDDFSKLYLPHMDFERGMLLSLNVQCLKHVHIPPASLAGASWRTS